ncbi:MAG: FadD3 family acyl-CoA ligase [Gordonia sp. (in: high G+C Gram-positive bacteria)]
MPETPTTTPAVLEHAAAAWPDGLAVIDDQWGAPVVLTWSALAQEVRRFAAALIAHDVQPGDRVAVWSPNSHHWPVVALGAHYAGAVLVPLNTRYTLNEARDIVERSGARVLVVAGQFAGVDRLSEVLSSSLVDGRLVVGVPLTAPADSPAGGRAAAAEGGSVSRPWHDFLATATPELIAEARRRAHTLAPDDLSDILFTSGTTGAPKGVMAEHRQTVAGARAWGANGGLGPADRYLMVNPFFHTFGYKAGILPCALFGTTMIPLAVYSPIAAMHAVARHRATVFPGAPTIFQTILDDPHLHDVDLSSLRLIVTGATIVPVVLIERLGDELGVDTVITAYGQTETSGFITTCRPHDDAVTVATTCGRPFDGMEIRLAPLHDAQTEPETEPRLGEVLTRGAMVMRGYLDDPVATAETVDDDGWLHTGDVGRLDDRGNLTITDRLKDMYICGGFNVYPAEVEQVLMRAPGVVEAAVVGVPDERLGEVGRAFLVVRSGPAQAADESEVLAFAAQHLADFKLPRSIEIVDAFPRNASGKILKRDLR